MAESFVVDPDNPSIRQIFEEYIEQQKARYTDPPWGSEANYRKALESIQTLGHDVDKLTVKDINNIKFFDKLFKDDRFLKGEKVGDITFTDTVAKNIGNKISPILTRIVGKENNKFESWNNTNKGKVNPAYTKTKDGKQVYPNARRTYGVEKTDRSAFLNIITPKDTDMSKALNLTLERVKDIEVGKGKNKYVIPKELVRAHLLLSSLTGLRNPDIEILKINDTEELLGTTNKLTHTILIGNKANPISYPVNAEVWSIIESARDAARLLIGKGLWKKDGSIFPKRTSEKIAEHYFDVMTEVFKENDIPFPEYDDATILRKYKKGKSISDRKLPLSHNVLRKWVYSAIVRETGKEETGDATIQHSDGKSIGEKHYQAMEADTIQNDSLAVHGQTSLINKILRSIDRRDSQSSYEFLKRFFPTDSFHKELPQVQDFKGIGAAAAKAANIRATWIDSLIDEEYSERLIDRITSNFNPETWVPFVEGIKQEAIETRKNINPLSEEYLDSVIDRFEAHDTSPSPQAIKVQQNFLDHEIKRRAIQDLSLDDTLDSQTIDDAIFLFPESEKEGTTAEQLQKILSERGKKGLSSELNSKIFNDIVFERKGSKDWKSTVASRQGFTLGKGDEVRSIPEVDIDYDKDSKDVLEQLKDLARKSGITIKSPATAMGVALSLTPQGKIITEAALLAAEEIAMKAAEHGWDTFVDPTLGRERYTYDDQDKLLALLQEKDPGSHFDPEFDLAVEEALGEGDLDAGLWNRTQPERWKDVDELMGQGRPLKQRELAAEPVPIEEFRGSPSEVPNIANRYFSPEDEKEMYYRTGIRNLGPKILNITGDEDRFLSEMQGELSPEQVRYAEYIRDKYAEPPSRELRGELRIDPFTPEGELKPKAFRKYTTDEHEYTELDPSSLADEQRGKAQRALDEHNQIKQLFDLPT